MLFLLPIRVVLTVSLVSTSRILLNNLPVCSDVSSNLSLSLLVACDLLCNDNLSCKNSLAVKKDATIK